MHRVSGRQVHLAILARLYSVAQQLSVCQLQLARFVDLRHHGLVVLGVPLRLRPHFERLLAMGFQDKVRLRLDLHQSAAQVFQLHVQMVLFLLHRKQRAEHVKIRHLWQSEHVRLDLIHDLLILVQLLLQAQCFHRLLVFEDQD